MDRVQKIMSNAGYCSRRQAEDIISQGRVKVNGKKITLGDQASPEDKITIDGKRLYIDRPVYLIFHKPRGCVTAVSDSRYRTVMHYIHCKERVFPVGRLDMNTSGLLLLTNDGDFANKIMHPRYEITKTYEAELDKPIGPRGIAKLERGVDLGDFKTQPAKVHRIHPQKIELTIHEGKNRIVRKMLETIGYRVLRLHRTKIGALELGKLKSGKYKRLHNPPINITRVHGKQHSSESPESRRPSKPRSHRADEPQVTRTQTKQRRDVRHSHSSRRR